jgi:methyltransferase (TIGR00027 family)
MVSMRSGEASMTARGVAVARSLIERPEWPTGDAAADDRLIANLADGVWRGDLDRREHDSGFFGWLRARTVFFDAVLTETLRDSIEQVVILGAGYDGRALRYRTPGVQFFEVDHPATQADKRQRLQAIDASLEGIVFVAADFTEPGLAERLRKAGHDASRLSLFICEGVLRYLPEPAYRELLRVAAVRAVDGSMLAASVSTRDNVPDERERAREEALADAGEAVLTVPPRAIAMEWITKAGWNVAEVVDASHETATARRGRLLVRARR